MHAAANWRNGVRTPSYPILSFIIHVLLWKVYHSRLSLSLLVQNIPGLAACKAAVTGGVLRYSRPSVADERCVVYTFHVCRHRFASLNVTFKLYGHLLVSIRDNIPTRLSRHGQLQTCQTYLAHIPRVLNGSDTIREALKEKKKSINKRVPLPSAFTSRNSASYSEYEMTGFCSS